MAESPPALSRLREGLERSAEVVSRTVFRELDELLAFAYGAVAVGAKSDHPARHEDCRTNVDSAALRAVVVLSHRVWRADLANVVG